MSSIQRIIKYFAIALAAFLIVSIFTGIYRFGFSIFNGIIHHSGNGLKIEKYADDANILSIDIAISDVAIKKGEELKVDVKNNKHIKIKQINNKISVTEKSHNVSTKNKSELIIYVPKDIVFDEVYISTGAGKITVDKLDTQKLKLEMGAGEVNIKNIYSRHKTEIEGGAGTLTVKNSNLNDLKLESGIGKVILKSTLTGKAEIEAGVGEINIDLLDEKENYTIETETGIGSIKIDDKKVKNEEKYGTGSNKIKIEGGIGSISVNFKK